MTERETYAYIAEKYMDTVFRVSLNYVRNVADAEDVTQNVFLKLIKERKPFNSEEHIKYWLIRVAINECKNTLRYKWKGNIPLTTATIPFTFDNVEQSELYLAFMKLPKKYRLPIYLYYYEGYTTQQIGELLNISKNTVCTHLKRGREKLKLYMEVNEDA